MADDNLLIEAKARERLKRTLLEARKARTWKSWLGAAINVRLTDEGISQLFDALKQDDIVVARKS